MNGIANGAPAPLQLLDLRGKKGLVIGIANDQSIAYGCARHCHAYGAELAITYLNEKSDKYVRPLAEQMFAPIYMPCDVREDGQLEAVFKAIEEKWGRLDFVIHSIAYANRDDLHGRVTDCSREGFSLAMDVSCFSFVRCAKLAEPLMKNGGSLITVSFYGGRKVVEHYNVMGPVKAALESTTKYLAHELGPKGIRVLALSPGPLKTRAASGIDRFDELMDAAAQKAPTHQLADINDCGSFAAYLVSDLAKSVTGTTLYIDGGAHIVG
ncbi:Enoyl-[acyl-carrier-protein] reductase [NADH] 1 [Magnetospirillum sp. XM-1]|uniref:enoyl-ACP reductase FabI n=1 Tax=Magnetospirillum sp. XM-1 TaxID=1663591 RepID=UPI00073DF32D|nr:enoyl-ACP reductase FabI [Magnetospirillum sp. XM-1]CUW37462.1 Enoyl-[acyl-carrier-protein] reductase [NADH] 1 [Magnetospirillum sp. XM-1]